MKLIIKNFVKIKNAEIELKPLTIFVGKNSTNKSYIAHIVYEALNKVEKELLKYPMKFFIEEILKNKSLEGLENKSLEFKKEDFVYTFNRDDVNRIFNSSLVKEDTIVKFIYDEEILSQEEKIFKLEIKELLNENKNFKDIFNLFFFGTKFLSQITGQDENKLIRFMYEVFVKNIIEKNESIYFPSSRSGFVLGFQEFIKNIISSEEPTSSFLTKPVIDFLIEFYKAKTSINIKEDKSLSKFEDFINTRLIKGEIIEEKLENNEKRYLFKPKGSKIKLKPHVISSATLELLPFVAILRSLNSIEGASFIIEEPEAHLHPEAQIEMARFITLLANNINYVLITTHSDYIINEISNCIRLHTLKEKSEKSFKEFLKRENLENYPDIAINPEDIAIYLFKEKENYIEIKKLNVNKYGIEDENFEEVLDELINRSAELGSLING